MEALYKEKGERFFAAANTEKGFLSYFEQIFFDGSLDRIYILKGGPGVGKSTFMKKAGQLAEEKGFTPEYFHCSSDPYSLDGVIIKEKGVCIIDGTSPHAIEPRLCGARDIIVDLGRAWDTKKLSEKVKEISEISKSKAECYKQCYSEFACKGVVDGCIENLVEGYVFEEKLEKCACRLYRSLFKSCRKKSGEKAKTRITTALSCKGKIRLSTFEDMADYCIFLKPPYVQSKIASKFIKTMEMLAKEEGYSYYISYNPQNPSMADGIYFCDIGVSVSIYDNALVASCDRCAKGCKIINCARFVDAKRIRATRPLRRFYAKLSQKLEGEALCSLAKAGSLHARLEEIYSSCTDYKKVEKITGEYLKQIF